MGAVNTLSGTQTKWLGARIPTSAGFSRRCAGACDLRGMRAAILGAGGAARAVAVALSSPAREVTCTRGIASAQRESVAKLVERKPTGRVFRRAEKLGSARQRDAGGNVSGRRGYAASTDAFDGRIVYDLVYNPRRRGF